MTARITQRRQARRSEPLVHQWPSLVLLAWWALVMDIVRIPGTRQTINDPFADAIQAGSLTRVVIAATFAGLGIMFIPQAWKALDRHGVRLTWLLGGYLAWAAATLLWSQDPTLSSRRLILLMCLVTGAFGLGAGYYGTQMGGRRWLIRDMVVAGIIAAGTVWLPAISSGNLNLLSPGWALTSVSVGTAVGYPVLFGSLAAVYARRTSTEVLHISGSGLTALWMGGLVTIVSLRKRVLIAVASLGISGLTWMYTRGGRHQLVVKLVFVLGLAAVILTIMGVDLLGVALPVLLRGEDATQLASLTGRAPLWEELLARAGDRPWHGVGFGAFWTSETMADIYRIVRWPAAVAHNGYIDETLATGLVGAALLVSCFVYGLAVSLRIGLRERDAFMLLVFVMVASYLLVNMTASLMQNFLEFPFYASLTALFAAFTRPPGETVPPR